jgi:hypothetical protein
MFKLVLLTLIFSCTCGLARTGSTPPVDADYIAALSAANSFLHAWQAHDEESAVMLLSDRVRAHNSPEVLTALFAPHAAQAYELSRGRKLAPGRYQFPIALFSTSNAAHRWTHPRATALLVVRTAKNDWLIDRLP